MQCSCLQYFILRCIHYEKKICFQLQLLNQFQLREQEMIVVIGLLFVLCILFYLWINRRPNNFPPGPPPLPFVGNLFDLPKPPRQIFQSIEEWSQKYHSPIIGLTLGRDKVVFVTGVDDVLAAFRKEEFQARPNNHVFRAKTLGKRLGILLADGEQWSTTRRFVVKKLKAYGKNEKENIIANEINRLISSFKDKSVIQGTGNFFLSTINIIWTLTANKRIDLNNKKSEEFLRNFTEVVRAGFTVSSHPITRFFNSKLKAHLKFCKVAHDFMREEIRGHQEILDSDHPKDIFDHFLIEMQQNNSGYFTEDNLVMVGFDLFAAGGETTSNSLDFVLLYMVLYPGVQERMQEELDYVLGRARKPRLDDRENLHYTMAVLTEVERMNPVIATPAPHRCTKDTTFGGYFIPKETTVIPNIRSVGYDPKFWKSPEEFNPSRFLSDEGKFVRPAFLCTFGVGPRVCLGEEIARHEIFLFAATLFHQFTVSLPSGEPKPSTFPLPGISKAPQPFNIKIERRH